MRKLPHENVTYSSGLALGAFGHYLCFIKCSWRSACDTDFCRSLFSLIFLWTFVFPAWSLLYLSCTLMIRFIIIGVKLTFVKLQSVKRIVVWTWARSWNSVLCLAIGMVLTLTTRSLVYLILTLKLYSDVGIH